MTWQCDPGISTELKHLHRGITRTRGQHETPNEVTQHDEESGMKFLFDNESFSFETLRTAGFAAYGGADLRQGLPTPPHTGGGDEARRHHAREATVPPAAGNGQPAFPSRQPRRPPGG